MHLTWAIQQMQSGKRVRLPHYAPDSYAAVCSCCNAYRRFVKGKKYLLTFAEADFDKWELFYLDKTQESYNRE